MERWIVHLDATQLESLNHEQRDLGTLVSTQSGEHYLVFRDSFVALKVANRVGAKRSQGRALPKTSTLHSAPLAQFDDGNYLFADA